MHDIDDALQVTLLHTRRAVGGLRDANAARPWLFSIATNTYLTELEGRSKRVLPQDFGPASGRQGSQTSRDVEF